MLKKIIYFFLVFMITSCANIITPDGGERDKQAPEIKAVYPSNSRIPIHTSIIKIKFDEYIKIKNQNNITINPSRIKIKKAVVKGKILEIHTDSIPTNTTINLAIDGAISDITEENTIVKKSIVLYTGETPDSLSIKLKVTKPQGNKGNLIALLFSKELPDTNPENEEPDYIYKGKDDVINCLALPKKDFHVIVLNDENQNNKIEETELTGFLERPIEPDTSREISYKVFLSNDNTFIHPKLIDFYSQQYGTFVFVTSPRNLRSKLIDNNLFTEEAHTVIYPGKENDTIVWYSPMADMTEGHFDLFLNDEYFRDLTSIHMNNTYMMRKLKIFDQGTNESILDLGDTVRLILNNPIYKFNKERCEVYIDSVKQKITDLFYFTDNEKTRFRYKDQWKPQSNYILKFLPGAFEDVFYQKNDTFQILFRTQKETEYGSVTLRFKDCFTTNLKFVLLDEQEQAIRSKKIQENEPIELLYLKPGKYHLMVFEDKNFNNERDPGYFRKKELPERYFYLNKNIEVLPNIQLENMEISLKNVD